MKNILIVPILLLSIGLLSCKKETVPEQQVFMQQKNVQPIINPGLFVFGTCGDWYVSLLIKNRTDLTSEYRSLHLTFCPDNTVVISNDIMAVSGNWYVTLDKGNPITLIIDLNYPVIVHSIDRPAALWADLEGAWKINKLQKNMIGLQLDEPAKKLILERGSIY